MVTFYRVKVKTEKNEFETICTSLREVYESLADFVRTFNVDMKLDELFEDIVKLSNDEFVAHNKKWYYIEKTIEIK